MTDAITSQAAVDGDINYGEIPSELAVGSKPISAEAWAAIPPHVQDEISGWASARETNRVEQRDRLKGEIEALRSQVESIGAQQTAAPQESSKPIPGQWHTFSDAEFEHGYNAALSAYDAYQKNPEDEGLAAAASRIDLKVIGDLQAERARRAALKEVEKDRAQRQEQEENKSTQIHKV